MTRFTRVRLAPLGPFHFGDRGVGLEHTDARLPADTLFSALCVTLAEFDGDGELDALLRRFTSAGQAPFRLTSLMPCAAGVYLLPYPLIASPRTPAARDLRRRKLFKDIAWTSEAVFHSLVAGKLVAREMLDRDAPITVQGGKAWVTAAERERLKRFAAIDPVTGALQEAVLWRTDNRPHVTVDRVTSANAVFSSGATQFNRTDGDWAGLYTVIEWLDADADLQARVSEMLFRLGETGIGGEQSSEYNQFAPHLEDLEDWDIGAERGSYFTTLSPYHPRPGEAPALLPNSHYEITLRRGAIRMLIDGSVLRWPDGDAGAVLGDLVDATPRRLAEESGQRIYIYGLAFPICVADAALQKEGAG